MHLAVGNFFAFIGYANPVATHSFKSASNMARNPSYANLTVRTLESSDQTLETSE